MFRKAITCCLFFFAVVSLCAQTKAGISNGPVTTTVQQEVPLLKSLGSTRKYVNRAVYVKKDDWLVVMARSSDNPISVDIYDRQSKKYIFSLEDTAKHDLWTKRYRTVLAVQMPRTDSFDVLCSAKRSTPLYGDEGDEFATEDTMYADYSIARLNAAWQPSDTNWGILQRLNYLASHWTAGFRTVAKTYDKDKAAKDGKITEYFPEAQVAINDRMQCSIFPLAYGQKLVYFMYSNDTTYAAAKALYDELSRKLKPITDRAKISDLSSMRRVNELATTYFGIKIPESKAPPEFSYLESAGKNQVYLPVSLFLYGNKQKAKVLVVMGDQASDIYDIGW